MHFQKAEGCNIIPTARANRSASKNESTTVQHRCERSRSDEATVPFSHGMPMVFQNRAVGHCIKTTRLFLKRYEKVCGRWHVITRPYLRQPLVHVKRCVVGCSSDKMFDRAVVVRAQAFFEIIACIFEQNCTFTENYSEADISPVFADVQLFCVVLEVSRTGWTQTSWISIRLI